MSESTPAPSAEASAAPAKHVTPVSTGHALFGSILTVVKEDAEYVYAEIKDAFHYIEARFAKSEVRESNPPAAANASGSSKSAATA